MSTLPDALKKEPLLVVESQSEEETLDLAHLCGRNLKAGDWVALVGELGSGKTVFAKGLGEAVQCREQVHSPTFVVCQTYKTGRGHPPLHHVDLYRIVMEDLRTLDWNDLMMNPGITVVEWAEKIAGYWPSHCVAIRLSHRGHNQREVCFYPTGTRAEQIVGKMRQKIKTKKGKK